ncbi:glycosyltransferase family 4 protein [Francisella tularensis]|uniref:glycosyltransferase family 4 protein n=1 Tax=Francisella tularensis TaxID=263 RepID=UPI00030FF817|nr:glycosyltransferase family 4 protein [Francisella tularensis]MBK2335679.1 glycosyltransferase family 4 protein [Francisella tularensis subsp. novicida]
MKILFLSLLDFDSISQSNIYTDLLREILSIQESELLIISPTENKNKRYLYKEDDVTIIKPYVGTMTKVSLIKRVIPSFLFKSRIKRVLKSANLKDFDLFIYCTPPTFLSSIVKYVKQKNHGIVNYLLLKDIFPQNAVDLGFIKKNGLLYKYFRRQEKELYKFSDLIGCMSDGNVKYVINNNRGIDQTKIHILPNCEKILDQQALDDAIIRKIKQKYSLPLDKTIFVYGGNLGKPQGLGFLVEFLTRQDLQAAFFIIVGSGASYNNLDRSVRRISNVCVLAYLPKQDFMELVSVSDVGMVFLDARFTIPNIPSRILAYMQKAKPILAVTDSNTDLKEIILDNHIGVWTKHGDYEKLVYAVEKLLNSDLKKMGNNSRDLLIREYDARKNAIKLIGRYKDAKNERFCK